jgi:hypothetical protein
VLDVPGRDAEGAGKLAPYQRPSRWPWPASSSPRPGE